MDRIKFYNDRICLNVLAGSYQNAIEISEATDNHTLVGILSANYDSIDSAIEDMKRYQELTNQSISVGLGAGNPNQWYAVAKISEAILPLHVNQIFSSVGYTRALVKDTPWINSLISPSDELNMVNIATGPLSKDGMPALVPIETAILLIKEMGGSAVKYFPMKGLKYIDQFRLVARACAKHGLGIEPTGGIDLDNFKEIVQVAIDENVEKIIPHVYSSIIDEDGQTRIEDVKKLYQMMKELTDN